MTVDVKKAIYDRAYPNESWGYEVFSLPKGIQNLDGKTALKFARSRHSTSDFDRSERQQLLIKAIKEKALSLGVLTDTNKISNLIDSVKNNLSTDLTVGDLVNIGINFKDADSSSIFMYNYHHECGITICPAGGLLYQPAQELFGNSWVLLPDGATRSRLSQYDDTAKFATFIFQYPELKNNEVKINILPIKGRLSDAKNLRIRLMQFGFLINTKSNTYTGELAGNSKIIVKNFGTGKTIDDTHIIIKALKHLEPNITIEYQNHISPSPDEEATIDIIL